MTETRPNLILNPSGDAEFNAAADAALRFDQTPQEFQALLRRDYPRAVVRARDLSAERTLVWYVYRDGHWVANDRRTGG